MEENTILLSVSDSGPGVTPDEQSRIFEKFYRAPEVKIAEPRGLGLGLAITQRLVAAHSGHLDVESQPGAGSTFRVRLPRAVSAVQEGIGGDR